MIIILLISKFFFIEKGYISFRILDSFLPQKVEIRNNIFNLDFLLPKNVKSKKPINIFKLHKIDDDNFLAVKR